MNLQSENVNKWERDQKLAPGRNSDFSYRVVFLVEDWDADRRHETVAGEFLLAKRSLLENKHGH